MPVEGGGARFGDGTTRPRNGRQTDLHRHVVRLHLDMSVSLAEENEVERILRELQGTDAAHGRAGILLADKINFRLEPGSGNIFPEHLPPVVRDTIERLDRIIEETD